MAASQQQMSTLLQALLAKGLSQNEALPTLKALMVARIFSLDDLTDDNIPASIRSNKKIKSKLLKKKKSSRTRKTKGDSDSGSGQHKSKKPKATPISVPAVSPQSEHKKTILINRSPVLTLWATVVIYVRLH